MAESRISQERERPMGVTAVAWIFFALAVYLCAVGGAMLARPGIVSMAVGAPLLGGLETWGPYMFLLTGGVAALIGWGLLRLNRWARRAAILVAMIGFALLIPPVSAAVISIQPRALFWGGLGIIIRMAVVWYLWQTPTAEAFAKPPRAM